MSESKVYIISPDVHVQSLFELVLSRSMDVECETVSDYSFAKNTLASGQEFDFLIIHVQESETLSELMDVLKARDSKFPILFTCENKLLSVANGFIGAYEPAVKIPHDRSEEEILDAVRNLLGGDQKKQKAEYCKMGVDMFSTSKKTKYDLFLKISEKKFVKIFHKDEIVSSADVTKYVKKGIKYFWLKSGDFQEVTSSLVKRLNNFMKLKEVDIPDLTQFSMMSFDSAIQLVSNLGIDSEVVETTTQALEMTTQLIQKNPKLKDLLDKTFSQKNYMSEHSLMLSFVACAIAKELDMHSLDTTKKLCYAAFFHDLTLEDERLANITTLKGDEEEIYGEEKFKEYINHPSSAAELVDSVAGLPPDVGRIIAQHHERPDGSGFPQGLDEKRIFPLAADFIVAEEFVNAVYEIGLEEASIEEIILGLEERYDKAYFRKAVEALKKALGVNSGFGFSLFNKKSA